MVNQFRNGNMTFILVVVVHNLVASLPAMAQALVSPWKPSNLCGGDNQIRLRLGTALMIDQGIWKGITKLNVFWKGYMDPCLQSWNSILLHTPDLHLPPWRLSPVQYIQVRHPCFNVPICCDPRKANSGELCSILLELHLPSGPHLHLQ